MNSSQTHSRLLLPIQRRYVLSLAALSVATLGLYFFDTMLGSDAPLIFFTLAVAVSAYFGGMSPGLFSTALGLVVWLFFISDSVLSLGMPEKIRLVIFVLIGALISILNEALHARHRAHEATLQARDYAINLEKEIVQHRKSQATIHEQRELLQFTLASIGDGVLMTNAQGGITFMNPAAVRLTGWDLKEAQGKKLVEVLRVLDQATGQMLVDPVSHVLEKGPSTKSFAKTILQNRLGQTREVEERASPIRDDHGVMHGIVVIFHETDPCSILMEKATPPPADSQT